MFSNYFIYLSTLPKEEKIEQIFTILLLMLILFIFCVIIELLKSKFRDKNKDNLFQKYLKSLKQK